MKDLIKKCRQLAERYRVTNGSKFRLKHFDPDDTLHFNSADKDKAKEMLAIGVAALEEYQQRLYAQNQWALLAIFQAMDAAGKDGAIKHVMSGVNPQGCQVYSFKAPSREDLDHDFLWRCTRRLPERGCIGIFNRSYYEETLVVRVHPSLLENQRLPEQVVTKNIWKTRFKDIRHFEDYLTNNGIVVVKFFLHLSKGEQKKRFLARLDTPDKNWKFEAADLREREYWDDYQRAYEEMIQHTATENAPWYVVPADNKWFTRMVVAAAIIQTLDSLKLKYPTVSPEQMKGLRTARRQLMKRK